MGDRKRNGVDVEKREAKPHWERRRTTVDRMVGTSDRLQLWKAVATARRQRSRMQPLPRSAADPGTAIKAGTVRIAAATHDGVQAGWTKDPSRGPGFSGSGAFVEVRSKHPFAAATLQFALAKDSLAHLDASAIVVARWDAHAGRFALVPQSGYDERLGHAFARITRPGIYTAVGMPRDPRIRTTLQLLRTMQPWMPPGGTFDFLPKICGLILCNQDVQGLVDQFTKTGKGLEHLGFEPGDFRGGFGGGNVCEMCLGTGAFGGIDLDILDVLDLPPIVVKPWPWPPFWPRPCGAWVNIGPDNVPDRKSVV